LSRIMNFETVSQLAAKKAAHRLTRNQVGN
jgi:hypothetical protein